MINGHQPKGKAPLNPTPPNQGGGGQKEKEASKQIYISDQGMAFDLSKMVIIRAQDAQIIRFIWPGNEYAFFDLSFPTQEERDAEFKTIIQLWSYSK